MSKKINSSMIEARHRENESLVAFARSIEKLEAEGKSVEQLIKDAKDLLNIKQDDSIIVNFEQKFIEQNKKNVTFRNLVNFKSDAIELGLLDDKLVKTLEEVELELAKQIASKYDLEVEELYEE